MIEIKFTDGRAPLQIEAETMKEAVEKAVKDGKSLNCADLRWAKLSDADLRCANLRWAKLSDADLRGANLRWAKLSDADLRWAKLRCASLLDANLSGANLTGADIDYSCWPLWCGSLDVKIDKRIFCQLLYHTVRAGQSVEDEEVQALLNNPDVLKLANQFHHVDECGRVG